MKGWERVSEGREKRRKGNKGREEKGDGKED